MKCKNCGADLVNNKCEYCEYQVEIENDKEVIVYINNTYRKHPFP